MHFLMPAVFSSHTDFKEWFSNPLTGMVEGSQEYNESIVVRLHQVCVCVCVCVCVSGWVGGWVRACVCVCVTRATIRCSSVLLPLCPAISVAYTNVLAHLSLDIHHTALYPVVDVILVSHSYDVFSSNITKQLSFPLSPLPPPLSPSLTHTSGSASVSSPSSQDGSREADAEEV